MSKDKPSRDAWRALSEEMVGFMRKQIEDGPTYCGRPAVLVGNDLVEIWERRIKILSRVG